MSALEAVPPAQPGGTARRTLLRRLIDVVALPSSIIAPQERAMAGDVLLDMLFEASDSERRLCAQRLVASVDAPRRLLRYLAQCDITIAKALLEENEAFDASDLAALVEVVGPEHRQAIASRRHLPIGAVDALVRSEDTLAIRVLLRNATAAFSEMAIDTVLEFSRHMDDFPGFLVKRPELTPSQAMAMFWWSDRATRREILTRHSADRSEMIDRCADVFALASAENWADPVVRKTLQLVERRQRNRAAIAQSPYAGLEDAIDKAAVAGMRPEVAQEIGYLSGVKPVTVAKILSDPGGEAVAVLCKATGLKMPYLEGLWKALRRPFKGEDGANVPNWDGALDVFGLLSVAKAQTTLRYWNWSLSTAFSPKLHLIEPADNAQLDTTKFSAPVRTAKLVFGDDRAAQ